MGKKKITYTPVDPIRKKGKLIERWEVSIEEEGTLYSVLKWIKNKFNL